MRLDKLSCHGVILNHKNPWCLLRLSPERAFLWGHWWNSGSYRQTKMEAASLAGLTIQGQATSLQLQEAPRNRQTQAHAFGSLSRFPQLVEDLEDALLFLGRNPRPGILDSDPDFVVRTAGRQFDMPACRRKLDGIAEQV